MENTIFENINKVGKSSYETVKGLYNINTNIVEQLVEQQLALFSLGNEYTARQLELAGEAKGYKEVINGQTEIAADISSKVQGIARNTIDILSESKDEVNAWFEKGVKEAEKGIKEVAKTAPFTKAA
jgi:phasin family protein